MGVLAHYERNYHAPTAVHPGNCRGCTLDTAKHGKPVILDCPSFAIPVNPSRPGNRRNKRAPWLRRPMRAL